jgi:hypothetical protein
MKKKLPEFGSVKWQNMMEKRIQRKLKRKKKLDASERNFLEVQAIHNIRRLQNIMKLKKAM